MQALLEVKKQVSYIEVEAHHGHDAFLMPITQYLDAFNAYMQAIVIPTRAGTSSKLTTQSQGSETVL